MIFRSGSTTTCGPASQALLAFAGAACARCGQSVSTRATVGSRASIPWVGLPNSQETSPRTHRGASDSPPSMEFPLRMLYFSVVRFLTHLATATVSLLRYRARARRDTRRPCCSGPVGSDSTIRNPFFRAPPPRQFLSPPRKRVCAKWRAREPPLKAFAAKERTAAREVQVATAAASEGSARRHQGPPLALLPPSSATKRLAASRACSTRAPPGKQ